MKLKGAAQEIISAVNSALVRGSKTPLAEKTSLRTPVKYPEHKYFQGFLELDFQLQLRI